MSLNILKTAVSFLLLIMMALPVPAQNCWAPDDIQQPDPAVAKSAPVGEWMQDLQAASAILKNVPTLQKLPEIRLRNNMYLGYPMPGFGNTARVSANLYPPHTWEGECGLKKGADYFTKAHLHITFNEPRNIFNNLSYAVRDEQLEAYLEPKALERIGGETLYTHGAVILTPDHISPWVPVTAEEYLRFKEREAQKELAELEKTLFETMNPEDNSQDTEAMLREMEKTDPAQAKELRKMIEENKKVLEASIAESVPVIQQQIEEKRQYLADLNVYLAGLSPKERSVQAALETNWGEGRYGLAPAGTVGRGKLVKLNPALNQGDKPTRRIQIIVIQPFANDEALRDAMTLALRDVDYPALRRLIR